MTNICVFCNESTGDNYCTRCIKLSRKQKFVHFLNKLRHATTKINPHEELTATAVQIQHALLFIESFTYIPIKYFNPSTQNIDKIAQTYLFQCQSVFETYADIYLKNKFWFFRGTNITRAVPIITHANGNCLYNSVLNLMPSLYISPIELRVRTILELIINYDKYSRDYTQSVGYLRERWKDICNDHCYSDLYELAALCNVLECNIRSLYPRIDYHPVSFIYFTDDLF
jgi:hypothetical protein